MASHPRQKVSRAGHGLMAIGSSDAWEVTIDESLDRDREWEAEIEGPNLYVGFSLGDLQVLKDARDYLRSGRTPPGSSPRDGLTLGTFGASKVLLIRDDEDFDRCFLVIGASGRSTVRLSLLGEDMKGLSQALEAAVARLPED